MARHGARRGTVRAAGRGVAVVVLAAALGSTGCSAGAPPAPAGVQAAGATGSSTTPSAAARTGTPQLRVEVVAAGLTHVWDVGVLPDGRALISERDGRLSLLSGTAPGAAVAPVDADLSDVYVRGEGGLMGLAVHADFAQTRRFTTCQTHAVAGSPTDVRLVTWQLSPDGTAASRVADPLVGGLPINSSGRHSGCRPTTGADGALYVGTGDTARGSIPQDLASLGGKVLRVDLETGGPVPGNPFEDAENPAQRLIWTYGHRNVQGVAVRQGSDEVFSAEHGPDTDDEVNRLVAGGNYGWDPAQGGTVGGYDESVPMTDLERFPEAVAAAWSSGSPVEAVSGTAFLSGPQWGDLDGVLAVGALRGQKLLLMRPGTGGAAAQVTVPPELDDTFGRLRAVRLAPDGALLVSTSNGGDDKVLRVTPT